MKTLKRFIRFIKHNKTFKKSDINKTLKFLYTLKNNKKYDLKYMEYFCINGDYIDIFYTPNFDKDNTILLFSIDYIRN